MTKQETNKIKNKLNNLIRLNFSVDDETELYFETGNIKFEYFIKLKEVIDSENGELVEVDNIILTDGGLSLIINYLTNEANAEQVINELIWANGGFSICGGIDYISNEVLHTNLVSFEYNDITDEFEIDLLQLGLHTSV